MTDDDLVKHLRDCANGFGNFKNDLGDFGLCDTAANRIEELEAKLAKAVDALSPLVDASKLMQSTSGYNRRLHQQEVTSTSWSQWSKQLKAASAALAELEGGNDE